MNFPMAVLAKPNKLKKRLVKQMRIGRMVDMLNRFGAASLAQTGLPLPYSLPLCFPFRAL